MHTPYLTVSETAYQKLKVIFSLFGDKELKVEDDATPSGLKKESTDRC